MSLVENGDAFSKKNARKLSNVSVDDDDVEEIDTADCGQRFGRMALQLGLSLFVLGCLAGALIWSFNDGEAGENKKPVHKRDASINFTIYVDQYSEKKGTYVVTRRSADKANQIVDPLIVQHTSEEFDTWWYQDNEHKRIVHRLDDLHTMYVTEGYSFYVTQEEFRGEVEACAFWPNIGYQNYIDDTGLTNLTRHYSAIEKKKGGRVVYVYEGDPSDVQLVNINAAAFLVTAYADQQTGALVGWDTYFTAESQGQLFQTSYWYGSMIPSMPDNDVFEIPKECSVNSPRHTNRVIPRRFPIRSHRHRSHIPKPKNKV